MQRTLIATTIFILPSTIFGLLLGKELVIKFYFILALSLALSLIGRTSLKNNHNFQRTNQGLMAI